MEKNTRQEILKLLKQSDGFVSGQELSDRIGISRTAVWKAVGRLKEEGYTIEAVTNRGYRLLSASEDLLNEAELTEGFKDAKWIGHPVIFKEETGSTNADIFALSDSGAEEGTIAVASFQSAGKGRRGRQWLSPAKGNVYTSLLLKPALSPDAAPVITLLAALGAWEAACAVAGRDDLIFIKWPNDLVGIGPDGKARKLTGILTEMRLEESEIKDIVVGIGLNVNEKDFPGEIAETATSFSLLLGRDISRVELTCRMWKAFETLYDIYLSEKGFQGIKERYEKALINIGRTVRVLDPKDPFTGVAKGVNETGALLVETEEGKIIPVSAGEVSVRGVNGYV
ncbi:MAG: biotin--[acetyl-CoA-carboxylase] ligase [Lachnospiraceae bacterium]|nr:biotin--[acetyl-CoA-carboxylase] ligase [Lachnospiraceae bacterium]